MVESIDALSGDMHSENDTHPPLPGPTARLPHACCASPATLQHTTHLAKPGCDLSMFVSQSLVMDSAALWSTSCAFSPSSRNLNGRGRWVLMFASTKIRFLSPGTRPILRTHLLSSCLSKSSIAASSRLVSVGANDEEEEEQEEEQEEEEDDDEEEDEEAAAEDVLLFGTLGQNAAAPSSSSSSCIAMTRSSLTSMISSATCSTEISSFRSFSVAPKLRASPTVAAPLYLSYRAPRAPLYMLIESNSIRVLWVDGRCVCVMGVSRYTMTSGVHWGS